MVDIKVSFQDESEMRRFLTLYKNINLYNTSNDNEFKDFMEQNLIKPLQKILKKDSSGLNLEEVIAYVKSVKKNYKRLSFKINKKTIEINHKEYDPELKISLNKENGSISMYTYSGGDGEDTKFYSMSSIEDLKKDLERWMECENEE